MKHLLIAALLLISLSSKSFSQKFIVVGVNGNAIPIDTPNIVVNHMPLKTTIVKDSLGNVFLHYWFVYDSTMFKVSATKGLTLINPPIVKVPVPDADWVQDYKSTATTPTILKFRNLPCNINHFQLFRNGSRRPQSEYTLDCINNVIVYPGAENKDTWILSLTVFER